jgi:hypothetical protein
MQTQTNLNSDASESRRRLKQKSTAAGHVVSSASAATGDDGEVFWPGHVPVPRPESPAPASNPSTRHTKMASEARATAWRIARRQKHRYNTTLLDSAR